MVDGLENITSQEEERQEEKLFFEDYWKALSIDKQKQLFNSSGIPQLLKETEDIFNDNEFFQSIFITLKTDFGLMAEVVGSDEQEKTEDLRQRDLLSAKNFKKIKRLI